jgi:hypothetical protein
VEQFETSRVKTSGEKLAGPLRLLVQSEVGQYLLQRGILSTASIVDGDLKLVDASRRNRNFSVIRNDIQVT